MSDLLKELTKRLQLARSPQPELESQLGPLTPAMMPMFPGKLLKMFTKKPVKPIDNFLDRTGVTPKALGELDPYFTQVGGEGVFNAGKIAAQPHIDPRVSSYMRLLSQGKK